MSLEAKIKEVQADVAELKQLGELAVRQRTKDTITVAVRKLETELISLKEEAKSSEERLQGGDTKVVAAPPAKKIPESQLKDYSWDQSDKFVKIYLTGLTGLASLDNQAVTTSFTDESLAVRIENLGGKTLVFNINKTCHKISPTKSYHKVKSDYLLVFLAKHNPGSNWTHITFAEKSAADSKKSDEPKMDDKEDPSAGLMNMMKKMYEEGDDEMKKTIAKAWTESREKTNTGMPDFGGL